MHRLAHLLAPAATAPDPTPTPTTDELVPEDLSSPSSWWDWFTGIPLTILLIVGVSSVVLVLLQGLIRRITDHIAEGTPVTERGVLKPLADKGVAQTLLKVDPLATARRAQRARTLGSVLRSTAAVLVGAIAVFLVLDTLGVNIAPFIASAGIVGVALGFGAQSLVKDFLTGTFMLLEDQYGVGDVVDLGPATGTVEAVTLRVTKIRDADGTLWYVPNGTMVRVGNKTQGWATAVVEVDVDYFADLEQVERLLEEAAAHVAAELGDAVQGEPTITGIERLTAEAITLRMRVRTSPARQWEVARALRVAARRVLEQADVPLAGQRDALTAHRAAQAPADGTREDVTDADPHDTPVDDAVRPPKPED
ncbi:mechanosensitive ion channel family protein [Cellulomonas palmilytica]|nr:mechanosensitive ion channel family protein [Cellulomonas palmilytica]